VRYEILGGPAAGFGATMAQIQEVTTDISGMASVVLSQREPMGGTNTISVQIIRPESGVDGQDADAGNKRITVGYETLRQTWGGNAGARVSIKGPEKGNLGDELPYKIIVTNNMNEKTEGVLTLLIPPTTKYIRSTPPVYASADQILYWNIEIPPKSSVDIDVILRQSVAGRMMLESNFTPGGRVNISSSGLPTGVINPNQVYPVDGSTGGDLSRVNVTGGGSIDPASRIPVILDNVQGGVNNRTGAASVWGGGGGSVTLPGAPTNSTNLINDTTNNFEQLKLVFMVNPKTALKVGEGFEILFSLENASTVDIKNVSLQIPIPIELRNLEKYKFTGPKELRDNKKMTLDATFNIVQKFEVIESGKTVTMRVGFPTLLPAGYSIIGELLIDEKLVKRTQPLRIKSN
jgi:hypothetical protein